MISPNFYKRDWENLDLNSNNLVNWKKAIDIFKDRIEGRYFRQIEVLDNNLDRKIGVFSGFAIMSLACLLIESLEQFCSGNKQTIRGRGNDDINNDAIAFFDFFKRSDEFETFFDTEEKANVFYTDFRCGLLHQGHTKNKSLIHIRCEPMLQWIDNENPKEGISIQRRKFLLETKKVYDGFVSKLENNDLNYRKKHLLKKMQYIVDQK
jgi:hypothetical protein